MPDINKAASQDKSIQRIFENIEDKTKLIEEAFFDSAVIKSFSDGHPSLVAASHSHRILEEASNALRQNDIEEAAHQLRREVDVCNEVPKMSNTPYAKSGKAGLEALSDNRAAACIDNSLKEAWNKAWADDPAPFYNVRRPEK